MNEDFLAFKQYYKQAIKKVPADSFFYQNINHKFKHSVEVLHIGQKIMEQTPELKNKSPEFKDIAQKALLFHDVGRFLEALKNYKAEQNHLTSSPLAYDHGLIGYRL